MLDFRIVLEARNPARRCFRQYQVEARTDLFGVWVVEIGYGRIGTAGRSRCYVARDEGEARHLARSLLKRRASAPRRIEVAYRIRELIDPTGGLWARHEGPRVFALTSSAMPRARLDPEPLWSRARHDTPPTPTGTEQPAHRPLWSLRGRRD